MDIIIHTKDIGTLRSENGAPISKNKIFNTDVIITHINTKIVVLLMLNLSFDRKAVKTKNA